MKEENYKEGKKNGKWTNWYENGSKYAEGFYKDDKLDNKTTYYEDGRIRNGKVTYWYENGQIKSEGILKDGVCIRGSC